MTDQPEIERSQPEPREVTPRSGGTEVERRLTELTETVKAAHELERQGGAREARMMILKAACALFEAQRSLSITTRAEIGAWGEELGRQGDLQREAGREGKPLAEQSHAPQRASQEPASDAPRDLRDGEQTAGRELENSRQAAEAYSRAIADRRTERSSEAAHVRRDVRDTGGGDPTVAGARDASSTRRDVRGAASSEEREDEESERSLSARPRDGVGFQFNDKEPAPGEVDRYLKSLSEQQRRALENPKTEVTLYTSASRPGSEGYNQGLTEDRGDALKRELEERGVKAQINVVPLGEQEARREDRSWWSLKEPSDRDPEDRRDDHWDRTARIDIRPAVEKEGVDPRTLEGENLKDLRGKGEPHMRNIANTLGERVRDRVPLPRNPFAPPDPARDLTKLGEQAKDVITDAVDTFKGGPKEIMKKTGEVLVGGPLAEGGRDKMREQVEAERLPLYRAIAEGVAAGLDRNYSNDSNWRPGNLAEASLYLDAKRIVEGMSEAEKRQLGVFLTVWADDFAESAEYLAPRMEEGHFRRGVQEYFRSDKWFRSN